MSAGDLWSYNSDNKDFIVSPDPDTEVVEIGAEDVCLVLGSDGLTNVIRPQYAVDIVNTHEWRELEEERGCHAQLLVRYSSVPLVTLLRPPFQSRPCHSNHSRWLLRHGLRGWGGLRADNITVLTVRALILCSCADIIFLFRCCSILPARNWRRQRRVW